MRKIIFLLSLIALYSCSSDNYSSPESDMGDAMTRSADGLYVFDYNNSTSINLGPDAVNYPTVCFSLFSHIELNDGTITVLCPELVSKPYWIDEINISQVDVKVFGIRMIVGRNDTSPARTGTIVLRQPGSNKTLSIEVKQAAPIDNRINVFVNLFRDNVIIFTFTSEYPVGEDITVAVPYTVYNTRSEEDGTVYFNIPKGYSYYEDGASYRTSPFVHNHGDLTGYRLHPGSIANPKGSTYNYILLKYW